MSAHKMPRLEWLRKSNALLPRDEDLADDDIQIERFCDTDRDPHEPEYDYSPEPDSGIKALNYIYPRA